MAKKEPRGTRDMNSGGSQEHKRNNGGNRDHDRQSMQAGSRSGQSRTGNEWRGVDRERSGGRDMDTRHAGRGRDMEDMSQDMSRYSMSEENNRGRNQQWSGRGSERGSRSRGGRYPMDNLTYNVVTVLHEKSKGLEAFDRYLQDARGDDVEDLLMEIREQDERAIEELQDHLHRLLNQSGRGRRVA